MTFKLKALVASLALVSASSAFAAITTTDELFLNVYDSAAGVTFVKDLGVTGSSLFGAAPSVGPQVWNFGTDANWLGFKSAVGADALIYNVVSSNNTGTATQSYVSTYAGAFGALSGTNSPTNGNLKKFGLNVQPYINAVGSAMTSSTFEYAKSGATDATDFGFGFQTNWAGAATFNSTASTDSNLFFAKLSLNGTSNLSKSTVLQGPTGEFFQINATTGALSLQPLAAVPEPSETAMLLGGLLCVGAIARRRRTAI